MKQNILHVLAVDGPLHIMEIAEQIDGHPITVDQVCARLHEDEYIATIGGGRYYLTDDGCEHLQNDDQ